MLLSILYLSSLSKKFFSYFYIFFKSFDSKGLRRARPGSINNKFAGYHYDPHRAALAATKRRKSLRHRGLGRDRPGPASP